MLIGRPTVLANLLNSRRGFEASFEITLNASGVTTKVVRVDTPFVLMLSIIVELNCP